MPQNFKIHDWMSFPQIGEAHAPEIRVMGRGSAFTTFIEDYLIVEFMKNRTVCFRIIIEHLFYNFEHFQKILREVY